MHHARILAAMLSLVASTTHAAYTLAPYQTRSTGSWADAAAIGDVNGDGRNDVVVTTTYYFDEINDYKVFVYLQQPNGTLAEPVKFPYPGANRNGLAIGNLDKDKAQEIVIGHGGGITILDWDTSRGVQAVRSRTHYSPWERAADDVVLLDANRDGALDIVGQSWSDGAVLFVGDGQGGVHRMVDVPTPVDGYNDLDGGDFNGDGHADFVVLSGQGQTRAYVYYNNGTEGFSSPYEIDPNPGEFVTIGALGSGDFNGDGRDDLTIMRDRTEVALFMQDGNGQLQPADILDSNSDPNAMVGHDLDLDGREDLLVQHGGGSLGFYLQADNGLSDEQIFAGPYGTWFNTQGVAAGDIDGDLCPDVAVANYNYGLVLYKGEGCHPVADLAVNLGLTATSVALRLDNFGAKAAASPETTAALSVSLGTMALGTLPAGCTIDAQDARSARITCSGNDLAAGASRTLIVPVSIQTSDRRNALTVSASANTPTVDLHLENNAARKSLRVPGLPAGHRSPRTAK